MLIVININIYISKKSLGGVYFITWVFATVKTRLSQTDKYESPLANNSEELILFLASLYDILDPTSIIPATSNL